MILRLRHEPPGGGASQFISEVETGRHMIGRDGKNSMVLDIESVSREHGYFFDAQCRWYYCDLGSTNGSWVNGSKAGPTNVRLLRDSDLVQLANVAVRVTMGPSDDAPLYEDVSSLCIFHDREFKLELPFAGSTSRLVLSDLQNFLTGQFGTLPAMIVVWRPGQIELVIASDGAKIIVNGVEWSGRAGSGRMLFDRDELDAGPLKLVVCDFSTAKVEKEGQIKTKAALASLPPAAGVGAKGDDSRGATKVLPRVSSQSEPSAPFGSGSELFGAGQHQMAREFASADRETDQKLVKRTRYFFGDGNPQTDQAPKQVQRQSSDISAAPRFNASLAPPANDEAVTNSDRPNIVVGITAVVLAFVVVGLLISLFLVSKHSANQPSGFVVGSSP